MSTGDERVGVAAVYVAEQDPHPAVRPGRRRHRTAARAGAGRRREPPPPGSAAGRGSGVERVRIAGPAPPQHPVRAGRRRAPAGRRRRAEQQHRRRGDTRWPGGRHRCRRTARAGRRRPEPQAGQVEVAGQQLVGGRPAASTTAAASGRSPSFPVTTTCSPSPARVRATAAKRSHRPPTRRRRGPGVDHHGRAEPVRPARSGDAAGVVRVGRDPGAARAAGTSAATSC